MSLSHTVACQEWPAPSSSSDCASRSGTGATFSVRCFPFWSFRNQNAKRKKSAKSQDLIEETPNYILITEVVDIHRFSENPSNNSDTSMCQDIFVTSPAWLHERLILCLLLFVSLESLLRDFICRHSSKHSGFTAAFDMENMQPMLVIEVPTKDRTKSKFMRLRMLMRINGPWSLVIPQGVVSMYPSFDGFDAWYLMILGMRCTICVVSFTQHYLWALTAARIFS